MFLAEAVRRSRGLRKPAWTGRDQQKLQQKPVKPVSSQKPSVAQKITQKWPHKESPTKGEWIIKYAMEKLTFVWIHIEKYWSKMIMYI